MTTTITQAKMALREISANDWLVDLNRLLDRHDGLCCRPDVLSYTADELKCLYNWLVKLD